MATAWKKARGKLGPMAPLLGSWIAKADTPMGPITCRRDYSRFGEGYVRLDAEWTFAAPKAAKGAAGDAPKPYREVCLFGPDKEGVLAYWSYTNDGKKSSGKLSEAPDIHPQAVCFEAQMDHGVARQVFWPADSGGMHWVVEAKTKKGWSRLADHHYRPVS